MKRRNFLELGAAFAALLVKRIYAAKVLVPKATRALLQSALPPSSITNSPGVSLIDLVTGKTVPLGSRGFHHYFVSVDNIAAEVCFPFAVPTRNALVISAYPRRGGRHSNEHKHGALQRAVLSKLKDLAPDAYQTVSAAFENDDQMQVGRVLTFEFNIPNSNRPSFPVDCLIVVVFDAQSSEDEGFEWVSTAFRIASERGARRLIVPCLGREWRDKRSIRFKDFFKSFLNQVPQGLGFLSVNFSLYAQWPSFEL